MYQSKLDEEIEIRENEKYEVLEKQVQEEQNNFNAIEKKEFQRLWSFYCNNLNEIENRKYQIKKLREEEKNIVKELSKQSYVIFLIAIAVYVAEYFLSIDKNNTTNLMLVLAMYFVYLKIKIDIEESNKKIEEKIHESVISEIRHELYLNKIFSIKYQSEYLEANNKLHEGSTDKEKDNYEKYNNLHFTYVSEALIKLTKKNLE
jgi:Ca2+/Na+ antiporter